MGDRRLNRRLTLEASSHVSDGAGGFEESWTVLGVLWAHLAPRSGRERARDGAALANVSYRITVRGAPETSLERPRPQQRFRDGSRVFQIRAVTEADPEGRYLLCYADEEVVG